MSTDASRAPSSAGAASPDAPPLERAREAVRRLQGGVVVAFSGGVDSALLLKLCADELPGRVLAATADSPSYPDHDRQDALRLARELGVPHVFVPTGEMDDPRYRKNDADRCYFCKHSLFSALEPLAKSQGLPFLAFGANKDDEGDFRPGHRAAQEFQVRAPLLEAGLRKQDVREAARALGLAVWDKPASACLASRLPYGTPVDPAVLAQIERAEQALRRLGLRQFRVRHHGEVARLEVAPQELDEVLPLRQAVTAALKEAGYRYAALDLEGYSQGSLNRSLRA